MTCQNGHESTAKLLLKYGAGMNLISENEVSPLYRAYGNGHESTAKLLLNKGANGNSR